MDEKNSFLEDEELENNEDFSSKEIDFEEGIDINIDDINMDEISSISEE